jgi:nicotinate phosphoribosyltransferase
LDFGEKAIKFYENHGIDAKDKLIVFSDGLDVDTIIKIADHFKGRIKCTFGWGTNLTNDLGFPALSLVVKAVLANGQPLVKLSDNLAKAIGKQEEVDRYKRVCGYASSLFTECKY